MRTLCGAGKKHGDNIDADAFLTAAPGGEKTGNKYKSTKDFVETVNNIFGAVDLGGKTSETTTQAVNELVNKYGEKETDEYVTVSSDPNDSNKTVKLRRDVYEQQQKEKKEQEQKNK